jgi:hypothetical protein
VRHWPPVRRRCVSLPTSPTWRSRLRRNARRRSCRLTTTGGEALASPSRRARRISDHFSRVLAAHDGVSSAGSVASGAVTDRRAFKRALSTPPDATRARIICSHCRARRAERTEQVRAVASAVVVARAVTSATSSAPAALPGKCRSRLCRDPLFRSPVRRSSLLRAPLCHAQSFRTPPFRTPSRSGP